MKRLIITSLIILFLFQLSLPGRTPHDAAPSPGNERKLLPQRSQRSQSSPYSPYSPYSPHSPISISGKDKIKIICSPLGGYSMLPDSQYQIAYINPDGSVKWQKLNQMLWEISFTGANMWREFPPWILDQHQYEILSPFKFAGEEMVLNTRYFENLRKIARLSNQYNLTSIFDLFNGSETRVKPTRSLSENSF
jgi:hypothetical protein